MEELLKDCTYEKLNKNPTSRIEKELNKSLKAVEQKGLIDRQTRLRLAPSHCQPPKIYGLPKIHKQNRPLRPIVSSINSSTYNLAKMIIKILNPLVGKSCHCV